MLLRVFPSSQVSISCQTLTLEIMYWNATVDIRDLSRSPAPSRSSGLNRGNRVVGIVAGNESQNSLDVERR